MQSSARENVLRGGYGEERTGQSRCAAYDAMDDRDYASYRPGYGEHDRVCDEVGRRSSFRTVRYDARRTCGRMGWPVCSCR